MDEATDGSVVLGQLVSVLGIHSCIITLYLDQEIPFDWDLEAAKTWEVMQHKVVYL